MNKWLKTGLAFLLGAGVGAGTAYVLTKKKYEVIADEGINEAKKAYENTIEDFRIKVQERQDELVSKLRELNNKVKGDSPISYTKSKEDLTLDVEEEEDEEDIIETNTFEKYGADDIPQPINRPPYLISPNQYANNEMYNLCTLYMTTDKYIVDDYNDVVEDWESQIGADSINHFGEYEEAGDAIYVRNDIRMIDYEVLLLDNTLEEIQSQ